MLINQAAGVGLSSILASALMPISIIYYDNSVCYEIAALTEGLGPRILNIFFGGTQERQISADFRWGIQANEYWPSRTLLRSSVPLTGIAGSFSCPSSERTERA